MGISGWQTEQRASQGKINDGLATVDSALPLVLERAKDVTDLR